jgi:hypothetical protein
MERYLGVTPREPTPRKLTEQPADGVDSVTATVIETH